MVGIGSAKSDRLNDRRRTVKYARLEFTVGESSARNAEDSTCLAGDRKDLVKNMTVLDLTDLTNIYDPHFARRKKGQATEAACPLG